MGRVVNEKHRRPDRRDALARPIPVHLLHRVGNGDRVDEPVSALEFGPVETRRHCPLRPRRQGHRRVNQPRLKPRVQPWRPAKLRFRPRRRIHEHPVSLLENPPITISQIVGKRQPPRPLQREGADAMTGRK